LIGQTKDGQPVEKDGRVGIEKSVGSHQEEGGSERSTKPLKIRKRKKGGNKGDLERKNI
jgi:hypothetical protein